MKHFRSLQRRASPPCFSSKSTAKSPSPYTPPRFLPLIASSPTLLTVPQLLAYKRRTDEVRDFLRSELPIRITNGPLTSLADISRNMNDARLQGELWESVGEPLVGIVDNIIDPGGSDLDSFLSSWLATSGGPFKWKTIRDILYSLEAETNKKSESFENGRGEDESVAISRNLRTYYKSALSVEFLVETHLNHGRNIIRCDPVKIARETAVSARSSIAERLKTEIKQVPLVSVKSIRQNDSTAFFYIPRHIELILREIITNSLKATIRSNVGGGNEEICGDRIVEVSISLGKDDLSMKISDTGGGLRRKHLGGMFEFFARGFSPPPVAGSGAGGDIFGGLGCREVGMGGVREIARLLGGEIECRSLEGHGVDVYVWLQQIGGARF